MMAGPRSSSNGCGFRRTNRRPVPLSVSTVDDPCLTAAARKVEFGEDAVGGPHLDPCKLVGSMSK